MDKNAAMDRRFSLNMTSLPNPIAESTCVNLNGTTSGVLGRNSAGNHFRWGGSPISPHNRSNSSSCLNSSSTFYKNRSTATSPQRTKLNLSKIDPRTYADVQSRGLVSRIIQYHESGSRLNRSKSTSNLCSKSGQSSMVQLQKTDLPYRATQQNVTMTRIVPPKKSIFYGNTLSSLLRSNSVISIHKSDEEISSENRPILHPPPSENELAPTRSVLDVLKEISRKRINSDESDGIHDVNKKYCSRESNDTSYEPSTVPIGVRNIGLHNVNTPSIHVPSQSFKRQREQIVIPSPHTQNMNSACGATFSSARLPLQTQHSPEQIAKKRLCSYNNDITSSLSSSLIHANKRKFYEQQRSNMQRSPPSGTEEYETQKSKMHRQQSDLRFQQLTQSLSCNTPITPIPTTPLSQSVNLTHIQSNIANGPERLESGDIVKRTVSEPPLLLNNQTQKPKVTLFNRNYSETAKLSKSDDNSEEIIDNTGVVNEDECADIQFVKPKKSSSIINKKNPFIERTQKSKLAMMLSGLRGEIYQGNEGYDDVDKICNKKSSNTIKESNVPAKTDVTVGKVTPSTNSTATTITTNTTANFSMKTSDKPVITSTTALVPPVSDSDKSGNKTTVTSSSSMPTATTTTSILSGFKLTPSVTSTNTTTSITTSPIISTTNTPAKTSSPLVGLKLTPQKPTPTLGSVAVSSAPSFNLNTTITTTATTASATVPQLQGFSFGTSTNTTSTTAAPTTTTTASSTTASAGGFKFGLAPKAETSTTVTTVSAVPAFGSFGNSTTPTSKPVSSEAAKPTLTFNTNTINTTAAVVKPAFNFGGGIAASAPTASTTTAIAFNTVSSGTFNFGGATNPTTSVDSTVSTAQTSSVFGSIAMSNTFKGPTEAATKPFAFGTTTSTAPSTASTTATPAFSFGGATVSQPTAITGPPTVTTNNIFGFGGQKSTTATTLPTTTGTTFAFGGNKTVATTTSATTPTNAGNVNKPALSFGQSGVKSLSGPTNTNSPSGNLFAFGGSSTTTENKVFGNVAAGTNNLQATGTNSIQPGAFTFGAATNQGATSTFGAVSSAASAKSSFGATTTTTTSTPFAFGGSNANKSTSVTSTGVGNNAPAGGFSFGASTGAAINASNTPSANIFGAATPAPTAAASITKPAFNFGSATTTSEATKSIFGGSSTNTNASVASNSNTFGALAGANSNSANKTFNFGGANTASNNNASPNLFAAAGNKSGAGGFSFGTSTMGNKPAAATNATPFAFGGGSTNGNATFSFGNSTGSAPANKTFSFASTGNAPAAPTANANSIFGGAQQTSAATFSFSAGTSASAAPSTVANIFAPPAAPAAAGTIGGGATTTDRPIRRATRRLQKT
uniref:Nucleoporin NSP1 n=1 Tax=Zeugodacus cucurbitae TaxID=28588 RepID=A0A0A1WVD0_ZEUCU